jgi:hypothetical protein
VLSPNTRQSCGRGHERAAGRRAADGGRGRQR